MDKNKLRAKILEQLPSKLPDAIRSRSMQAVSQEGTVGNAVLEASLDVQITLVEAVTKLRQAQKAYMADRGNEDLGKAVGIAAKEVDAILGE